MTATRSNRAAARQIVVLPDVLQQAAPGNVSTRRSFYRSQMYVARNKHDRRTLRWVIPSSRLQAAHRTTSRKSGLPNAASRPVRRSLPEFKRWGEVGSFKRWAKSGYPPACPTRGHGCNSDRAQYSDTSLAQPHFSSTSTSTNAERQTPCKALRPGTSRTDILLDPRF